MGSLKKNYETQVFSHNYKEKFEISLDSNAFRAFGRDERKEMILILIENK